MTFPLPLHLFQSDCSKLYHSISKYSKVYQSITNSIKVHQTVSDRQTVAKCLYQSISKCGKLYQTVSDSQTVANCSTTMDVGDFKLEKQVHGIIICH